MKKIAMQERIITIYCLCEKFLKANGFVNHPCTDMTAGEAPDLHLPHLNPILLREDAAPYPSWSPLQQLGGERGLPALCPEGKEREGS
jgi:hypothetical protein